MSCLHAVKHSIHCIVGKKNALPQKCLEYRLFIKFKGNNIIKIETRPLSTHRTDATAAAQDHLGDGPGSTPRRLPRTGATTDCAVPTPRRRPGKTPSRRPRTESSSAAQDRRLAAAQHQRLGGSPEPTNRQRPRIDATAVAQDQRLGAARGPTLRRRPGTDASATA